MKKYLAIGTFFLICKAEMQPFLGGNAIMNRFHGLVLGFLLLATYQAPSQAQVYLQPCGEKSVPMRVQSLNANVEIIGGFAITQWQMEIQLERVGFTGSYYGNGVVDFIVARPADAKVTAFNYQDNYQSNLVGRVVEKAVALPRVTFPIAFNDPLRKSGLNESNSFRATIYPLRSWSNMTLNGTWVQVLPAVAGRSIYRLPLLSLKGGTTRLTQLDAKIRVQGSDTRHLWSNYGLPSQVQGDSRVFALSQKNYRVTRDLTLTLAPQNPSLGAALLVAPNADKQGGHFALSLVADRALKNPVLVGAGLGSTEPILGPKSVGAGERMIFTGTYRGGADRLKPRLTAGIYGRDLVVAPIENKVADALWASKKIDALGAGPAHRAQVMELSKTYSVASRYTSWLTVGDEDLQIYRHALVSTQLDPLVREYWMHVGDNLEKSTRVLRLKRVITRISQANGLKVEDELYARLGSAINYAESVGWYYDRSPQNKAEKRLARLYQKQKQYAKSLKIPEDGQYNDAQAQYYDGTRQKLDGLRTKIMAEYRLPHPNYQKMREWQQSFAALYGSTDVDPRPALWGAEIKAQQLEEQTKKAEATGDQVRLAQLQEERNSNSQQAYFTNNIGDPPIYVAAPADARQVVAIMPDGQIKTLDYNPEQKRWEGNYDVPATTHDGDYTIAIVIVNADQSRRHYAMKFRVDTTPPTGEGQVAVATSPERQQQKTLRLEIGHNGDVARVTAILPWGEKVSLLPSTDDNPRFYAVVPVPSQYEGKAIRVTYILVDRAHNLTRIEAESVSPKSP